MKDSYFDVQITSVRLSALHRVYAYTDSYTFTDLMELIATCERPWQDVKHWESLEGDFKFSAMCSKLGKVTFQIELFRYSGGEEWRVKTELNSELGQLPTLAKSVRAFFGSRPTGNQRQSTP